MFNRR